MTRAISRISVSTKLRAISPPGVAEPPGCVASAGSTVAPCASNEVGRLRLPGMALFTRGSAACSLLGAASGASIGGPSGGWQAASTASVAPTRASRRHPNPPLPPSSPSPASGGGQGGGIAAEGRVAAKAWLAIWQLIPAPLLHSVWAGRKARQEGQPQAFPALPAPLRVAQPRASMPASRALVQAGQVR